MNNLQLIASGLDINNLSLTVQNVNTICSFTGEKITKGVANNDLIKKTFTDHCFLRYSSDYSSVDAAMCISAVIQGSKGFNSLRSYSFLATKGELSILKRESILETILNLKSTPFVLCVTYSNKKHTSYKSIINTDVNNFVVTTDIGNVSISIDTIRRILPVIESWYSIVDGKEKTSTQPTYFTKNDILIGCSNAKKIKEYGVAKYFKEDQKIQEYRNTSFLKLIVHILNKK